MITIATVFSGGGGVECGAVGCGVQPIWGLEYDAEIASVYRMNFQDPLAVANICDVNPKSFTPPDVFHGSPPCPSFSRSKRGGLESAQDIQLAKSFAGFISELKSSIVTLENVPAYEGSESMKWVRDALSRGGYEWDESVYNSADYMVPQTRKRFVVRAVRGASLPPKPVASNQWISWHEAVEDLLGGLPESKMANWQLARLEDHWHGGCASWDYNTFVDEDGLLQCIRFPVTGGQTRTLDVWDEIPILVEGDAGGKRPPTVLVQDKPMFTVKTSGGGRVHRIVLPRPYRVLEVTPRCLARFQSFPDWYALPEGRGKKGLAQTVIGNAVPPAMYTAILESLLPVLE